jgi:tellurium resistance protein TerD
MSVNLQKGQTINLEKGQYDLSQVTIGLGWDIRKRQTSGFMGKVLGPSQQEDYDLDVIAFLLDENEKVRNLGDKLRGSDVVFYNNLKHPSGTIWSTGDNRTGAGEGDDEQIVAKLNSMSPAVHKILFLVTIYEGAERKQHFGMVENAFIRAVDAKGREMARFDLSSDPAYEGKQAMIFGELYRKDDGWKFRAVGQPQEADSFVKILKTKYT